MIPRSCKLEQQLNYLPGIILYHINIATMGCQSLLYLFRLVLENTLIEYFPNHEALAGL